MHAYRPAIYRSYPFVPVINQSLKIVKTLDMTCTVLKDRACDFPGGAVSVQASSVEVENSYYPLVVALTERLLEDVNKAWFYNLKTGRWIPFKRLFPV